MDIELHHLRQFLAVADELHFGRAAARLCMAQPPLSQSIRRLEVQMGVQLLERTQRKVELTPAGRAFREEAERSLAHAEAAVVLARRAASGQQSQLHITFTTAALFHVLPCALRAFRQHMPRVQVRLEERATDAQLGPLQDGSIDIGLLHPPLRHAVGLEVQVVEHDRLMVAVPSVSPLAASESVCLEDLADQDFVLFPREQGPFLHDRITSACRRAGFTPRITLEPRRVHTILCLVGAGMGVSVVGAGARSLGLDGVAFVPLEGLPADFTWDLAVAWRAGNDQPAVPEFLDAVQQTVFE
jgi:DNA-binding transcriptional LysR family regulator